MLGRENSEAGRWLLGGKMRDSVRCTKREAVWQEAMVWWLALRPIADRYCKAEVEKLV
jgi:hypothetical protein